MKSTQYQGERYEKSIFYIFIVISIFITLTACAHGEHRPQESPTPSSEISPVVSTETEPTPEPTEEPKPVAIPEDYPPVDVLADENALLSANILTKRITPCIKLSSTPERPEFIYMMLMTQLSWQEDEKFCYYNIFPSVYYDKQFKATNIEKIARQLLGDYEWDAETDFGTPPNGGWNEDTMSYEFSTDFGWGMQFYYTNEDVYSEFASDNTQVISHFEMFGPVKDSPDPSHESYGNYRLIYDIVSEDGETFLRFNRYEKE